MSFSSVRELVFQLIRKQSNRQLDMHVKAEDSQIISIDDITTTSDGTLVSLEATTVSIEWYQLV